MHKVTRRVVVLAVAIGTLFATTAGAWAITLTTPTAGQLPFVVQGPPDFEGRLVPFTISVSGMDNQFQPAFAVQCDGVSPSSPGYTVSEHCDNGSSGTAVPAAADLTATFPANNSNTHLRVFKGPSPQEFFNCLSPNDPDPNNGLPSFRNCQVRVSAGTSVDTSAEVFFPIVLPDGPIPTTTTSTTATTSTSTSTTSTSTSTSTSTTTIPPPPNPTCTMGAGLPQTPPKPPKNVGLIKISKGLMNTPAVKDTKFKLSGTLDHCMNFPTVPKQVGPIDSGSIKLSVEVPPGSTCSGITGGFPVKSTLSLTFNAADPAHPGKFKKVSSEKTTLSDYSEASNNPVIIFGAVSQVFGLKSKTPGFATQHAVISFSIDQLPATLATACADPKKGLQALNFTGVNGPSTFTVMP